MSGETGPCLLKKSSEGTVVEKISFRAVGKNARGFTLVEMLVVIGIIGILASILLPAISRGKLRAVNIKCVSNMRQLAIALQSYAGDHEDRMPPRKITPFWTEALYPYYADFALLKCPAEKESEGSRRSYLINGWNDYFIRTLNAEEFEDFMGFKSDRGMEFTKVPVPSDTITFGEKKTGSIHAYMDFYQGGKGNDVEEVEHARHVMGGDRRGGSSNYAFADGSVRTLPFGGSLNPVNLWATTEEWRRAVVPFENIQ